MIFDDLNEKNFLLYAMKEYNNPQCVQVEEFYDDLKKVKYIKRLFNQYLNEGVLKERLLLNHIIVFYNVFPVRSATRILFLKIEEEFWPTLKTFLVYLNRIPFEEYTEIGLDENIIDKLRGMFLPSLSTLLLLELSFRHR